MEYNFKLTKPFGPAIAELTMPKEIIGRSISFNASIDQKIYESHGKTYGQ